jgi:protein tyrosine kinase modulator
MDELFQSDGMSWQDYRLILLRHRWSLLGSFFLFGLGGFGVALMWPNTYRSEALVLVEQQKVPEQYVTPNVVTNLPERLQSMTQQILSRARLVKLIEDFKLYPRERSRLTMDELVEKMRDDIGVEPINAPGRRNDVTAFRISYTSESPRLAQQVTNELTSLFIEENLKARTQFSASTTDFLQNQLQEARKDLEEQEQRLREYKTRFLGELPEQQQSNLQMLSSIEAQIRSVTGSLERAEQQKVYLESLKSEYQGIQESLGGQASGLASDTGKSGDPVLDSLRSQLRDLETKYTPRHPDVIKLRQQVAQLEAQQANTAKQQGDGEVTQPATLPGRPALAEIESRLKAVAVQIEGYNKDFQDLRKRSQAVQARLNVAPLHEQQLAEVTRNYENSREYYQSLLQKSLQSGLATNLEMRQQGEQFRIIDPATLPEKPIEPNRAQITLYGWILGLCVGAGLCALREMTDRSVRTKRDLGRVTSIPVLVTVPVLRSRMQEIRHKSFYFVEVGAMTALILVSLATCVYAYRWI